MEETSVDDDDNDVVRHMLFVHTHTPSYPHIHIPTHQQAASCGLLSTARDAFERAMELRPTHPLVHERLLDVLLMAGDTVAAQDLLRCMIELDDTHPWAGTMLEALRCDDRCVYLVYVW